MAVSHGLPAPRSELRKRKAHKKSRSGCRNCKMRRVKCDEAKPECEHCLDFGVSCNYDPKIPDLQLRRGAALYMDALSTASPSVNELMMGMMNKSIRPNESNPQRAIGFSTFDSQDLERLGRFQTRTVHTIGTKKTAEIYHETVFQLACSAKYLMHMVQSLTAVHDRYLNPQSTVNQNAIETYHLGKALVLFNEKLSGGIKPGEGDAVWATAALLGLVSFAMIDATKPEEAWPLAPPSHTDLEWLAMSDGKKAIWDIANPLRRQSVFHKLSGDFERDYFAALKPKPSDGILLADFAHLCNLDDPSDNNPYYEAVHNLIPLLDLECNSSTMMRFISFIGHMNPRFKLLLERKDPRAMLLLAYWYSKVCKSQWWVSRRASLECQAICIYLERHHDDIPNVHELLRFPKIRCGLLDSWPPFQSSPAKTAGL